MRFIGILLSFLLMSGVSLAEAPSVLSTTGTTADTSVTVVVPETFMEDTDLSRWHDIEEGLRVTPFKIINLEIQGFGGSVFEENRFIAAVKYAQAHGKTINMIVVGPSYSAHAMITCYANHVSMTNEGALMFHQMKALNTVLTIPFETKPGDLSSLSMQDAQFNQCIRSNILTPEDVKAILNDKEVTMSFKGGKLTKTYSDNSQGWLMSFGDAMNLLIDVAGLFIVLSLIRRALHIRSK